MSSLPCVSGQRHGTLADDVARQLAASAMTETIMPPEVLKNLKPEHIAPLVGVLTAKNVSWFS